MNAIGTIAAASPPREFYTREEVAELLQVSLRTVDEWIAQDKIPHTHIGRVVRIRRDGLAQALLEYTVFPRGNGCSAAMLTQAHASALEKLIEPLVRRIVMEGAKTY
ncbi:MAG: helix-turn-helix domain-containing protein [Verrucomicrobia bacterium]|nr:helix-turn-helix domain-containing protein [Verrucomicrobiota bacterium]